MTDLIDLKFSSDKSINNSNLKSLKSTQNRDLKLKTFESPLDKLMKPSAFDAVLEQSMKPNPALAHLDEISKSFAHLNEMTKPNPALAHLDEISKSFAHLDEMTKSNPALAHLYEISKSFAHLNEMTKPNPALAHLDEISKSFAHLDEMTKSNPALAHLDEISKSFAHLDEMTKPNPAIAQLDEMMKPNTLDSFLYSKPIIDSPPLVFQNPINETNRKLDEANKKSDKLVAVIQKNALEAAIDATKNNKKMWLVACLGIFIGFLGTLLTGFIYMYPNTSSEGKDEVLQSVQLTKASVLLDLPLIQLSEVKNEE
ncbi:hypothetical protein GCM10007916_01560 [Psychromonas marina]|uniref:Uncharacterized protein n=1 Tax=Psychromonas marina TaxID=88364 RepID=A0ABQ6DVE2_9GAMM|nr:hypothetical protein [Psychromonas marina]GLS89089.1 hypothetical protein GCM10007916_01560 [Psychromonas marina]